MQFQGLRNVFVRRRRGETAFDAGFAPEIAEEEAASPAAKAAWGGLRLAVAERLWGEGFVGPCGAEDMLRLAAPMGLSQASSLLLLGAGPGGPPLAITGKSGAWVSGHEADPVLVAVAERRILQAGAVLAKRTSVKPWAPAAPDFRHRAFHDAVAVEAIREAALVRPVLSALAQAIRPGGQLALVETVATAPLESGDAAVAAWCRLDRRSPELPLEADITDQLRRLGIDVRVVDDESERHSRQVVLGWERLTRALQEPRPSPPYAACLVAEAELWLWRLRLLREGRIRQVRWHGLANA